MSRRTLLGAGSLLCLCGAVVMAGWLAGSRHVVQIRPDFEPMKFNTAFLFCLLGGALVAAALRRPAVAAFLGAFVSLFALLTLSQYVFGWNLGIDTLFGEASFSKRPDYPGRFSITTGICFMLAGASAALHAARPAEMRVYAALLSTTAGGVILSLSVPSLFGYISGTQDYYIWGAAVGMALHTALLFAVLGACLLRLFFALPARHMGWLPIPVLGICIAFTVAIWHATVIENQNRQQGIVQAESEALARNATLYFEGLFDALDRMDRRWEIQGGTPHSLWAEDAQGYLKSYPVLQALSWADRKLELKWLKSLKDVKLIPNLKLDFSPVRKDAIACAVERRSACQTPVIRLLQGGMGFVNYNPLYAKGEFRGLLVATFIVDDIVGNLVPQSLLSDFEVEIAEDGKPVFSSLQNGDTLPGKKSVARFREKKWVFSLSPKPAFLEKNYSQLPGLALLVGMLISFLVSLSVHFAVREKSARDRLQHSRDQIALFIKNLPVSFAACDRDMRYIMVSDTWYRDFKLKDRDIIGKSHFDVFYNAPLHWREILEACLRDGTAAESEERVVLPTGRDMWMKWIVRPWHDEHGQIGGLMMATEITSARKRTEHDLLLAKQLSDNANRAKSEFLAVMSHEIRTPLNAIIGMARLLTHTPLDSKQAHYADTISRSSESLIQIVSDVLDLGKVEAGKMQIDKTAFNLRMLCSGIADVFMTEVHKDGSHGPEFKLAVDPAAREWVAGDELKLRQILVNLCGNAVKFTENGSVTLSVSVVERGQKKSLLRFSVADTGIGILPGKIEAIFGKYDQADAAVTRKFGGTGLGLTLARNFTVMMGGDISVKSVEGKGSTFSFDIWLDDAEPAEEFAQMQVQYAGARVLVVDDSAINREIMEGLLQHCGIEADLAADGQAAVAAVAACAYDLVFMDCQMPVMDGYAATGRIRALPDPYGRVPVVALSANALKEDAEKCRAAGMDDYLPKPILEKTLHATLAKWLDGCKLRSRDTAFDTAMLAETRRILGAGFDGHLLKYESDARTFLTKLAAGEDAGNIGYHGHHLRSAALHFGGGAIVPVLREIEKNPQDPQDAGRRGLIALDGLVTEIKAAGAWPPAGTGT